MIYSIKPICDVVVFKAGKIAMVDFVAGPDAQSGWYLPNDLLAELESPDEAAARIVQETFGQSCSDLRLVEVESFSGRDKSWHLAFHYACKIDEDVATMPEGVAAIEWFDPAEMPEPQQVAHHGWYLSVAKSVSTKYAA